MSGYWRWFYPGAALAALVLVFVLPMLRFKRRYGRWALVPPRAGRPVERLPGLVLSLLVAAVLAWTVAHAILGPVALGVPAVPGWVTGVAAFLAVAGLGVVLLGQAQMGASWRVGIEPEPTALVTRGLYRRVRNPIYGGVMLVGLALLLCVPSIGLGSLMLVAAALLGVQARQEERHLRSIHGTEFDAWAARTGRFLPGIGRIERGAS